MTEKYGYRCSWISERHRTWGNRVPAVDLDFIMLEYNFGKPVALVEYKHHNAIPKYKTNYSIQAITALADASSIPFMIVFYSQPTAQFIVQPVNDKALELFGSEPRRLNEDEYIAMLKRIRL